LEATTRQDPPSADCPHTVLLEGEPAKTLAEWVSAVPEVENLALAVPTRDVLMMITDLPSADPGEIDSMVELQAEEISPFPPERTEVAWEILRELDNGSSRVLMVLISQQKLERVHDLLLPTVGLPARLDVEVMGWLEMMLVNGHLSSGKDLWVLIVSGDDATLVAWHDDTPVLIRSLGAPEELSPGVIREELSQARVNVETAFPRARMDALHIWHWGEAPDWCAKINVASGVGVHSLDSLSPATHGVLVRSQLGYLLDLTPKRWKDEAAARRTRKKALRIGGSIAAAWLVGLGALMLWGILQSRQIRGLEGSNEENVEMVNEIRALSDQVRSLTQFTDRSRGALELLRILAESAPGIGALEVEELRYRKDGAHVFRGSMGRNVQPFNRFLDSLTASEALNVEDYDLQQSRSGYDFRLELEWEWGDLP
jgi:hypothetical protein